MLTASHSEFLQELPDPGPLRLPRAIMMIEPEEFSILQASTADNIYMQSVVTDPERARHQHQTVAAYIRDVLGVKVKVFKGRKGTPDDLFPNNVFASTPGQLIIGSMFHPERQHESDRQDIKKWFSQELAYSCVDLSSQGFTAELTGSLIIDHRRQVGFCGLSNRADKQGSVAMQQAFGLSAVYDFSLAAGEYHTNVVLSILAGRACVVAPGGITEPGFTDFLEQIYPDAVVVLSAEEKAAFAANCLSLDDQNILLSATAFKKLQTHNRQKLEDLGFRLHPLEVDELEKAGGSLRCLLMEVF